MVCRYGRCLAETKAKPWLGSVKSGASACCDFKPHRSHPGGQTLGVSEDVLAALGSAGCVKVPVPSGGTVICTSDWHVGVRL